MILAQSSFQTKLRKQEPLSKIMSAYSGTLQFIEKFMCIPITEMLQVVGTGICYQQLGKVGIFLCLLGLGLT
jgi:hypothetical protein